MIIISELTGKEYKTVEECKEAEEIFLKKKEDLLTLRRLILVRRDSHRL